MTTHSRLDALQQQMDPVSSGSCWCGKIKYKFSGEPALKAVCHCLTCRKVSGSSNTVNYAVPTSNFDITGTPKKFAKEHESGMTLTVYFCGDCGSTVYKEGDSEMFRGLVLVQAGSLDDVMKISANPGAELYVKDRVPWLGEIGGTGQMQEFS